MQTKKPVNCYKCSKILCMAEPNKEFVLTMKCPHCGTKQVVISEKEYKVFVVKAAQSGD